MKQKMESTLAAARKNLSAHNVLAPVALFFVGDELASITNISFRDREEHHKILFLLGAVCAQNGFTTLITINDAAMRMNTTATKEELEYIRDNYDTESPLCYPEGMTNIRKEVIIVTGVDLTTKEVHTLVQIYHREDDTIKYDELIDMDEMAEEIGGASESAIGVSILNGYSHPEVISII